MPKYTIFLDLDILDESKQIIATCDRPAAAKLIVNALNSQPALLEAAKSSGLEYGTFPDALENIATELDPIGGGPLSAWAPWLRIKAKQLSAAIADAEVE